MSRGSVYTIHVNKRKVKGCSVHIKNEATVCCGLGKDWFCAEKRTGQNGLRSALNFTLRTHGNTDGNRYVGRGIVIEIWIGSLTLFIPMCYLIHKD